MATYYNPKIITNNIEFSVDAANVKSWNGPTPLGSPYGYVSGGTSPSPPSFTERIDFSNDNADPLIKGNLSRTPSYGIRGTNNRDYGYLGGGAPGGGKSLMDRMDYSNDSVDTVDKGSLNVSRSQHGATGTLSYGYFAGGWGSGTNEKSSIDRVDYSNDTATAAPKGPLARGRSMMGTIGNQSYGYFAGGEWSTSPGRKSVVERFDFSNDTSSPADKGPLTTTAVHAHAAGNASYGYFGGGYDGSPSSSTERTTVDRIDYSSDTTACAAKGPLLVAKYARITTGDINYGYWCGGASPSVKNVDRIDFSNDTATASSKGALSSTRYSGAGHGTRFQAIPNTTPLWKDMTGHGDMTVDGPTFSGLDGGVWDFDGSNDYMEKTSFSGVAFGTGDFAVETWVRVDNLTANHMIFESRSGVSATEDGFLFLAFGSNNDEWAVWTAGAAKISGANGSVAADTWYHTIVTRISGTTTLYVNGVSIGSFSDSYNYSNDDLRIGKNVSSADYLNGKIALFRIYKARGFTASEVLNNFNATRTRFGV